MEILIVKRKIMSEIKDRTKARGEVTITHRDKHGNIKTRETTNLVVTVGLEHIADQMSGKTQAVMAYMEVGTDGTDAVPGDTALKAPIVGARKELVLPDGSKDQGTGVNANQVIYVMTFTSSDPLGDIAEAGIFNASTGGVMLCRTANFGIKSKTAGDSLTFTWKIIFSAV